MLECSNVGRRTGTGIACGRDGEACRAMRVAVQLLPPVPEDGTAAEGWREIPIPLADSGKFLWSAAARWRCRGVELALRVVAAEPLGLPEAEATEPVVGAIARLLQAVSGQGALVILENPATALGPERILFAEGVRLFGIATEADMACWDGMIGTGQPVYGVRGTTTLELDRIHPATAISALAYGLFTSDEGLTLDGLHEDRAGVAYVAPRATSAEVVIRGGFTAGTLTGAAGATVAWKDRGNEVVVRLAISDDAGNRCFTQPRFVVPR